MSKRFQSFDFSTKNPSQKEKCNYFDKLYTPQKDLFNFGPPKNTSIYQRQFIHKQEDYLENQFLPQDVYELYQNQLQIKNIVQQIKDRQLKEMDQLLFDFKENIMQIINDKKVQWLEQLKQNWFNFDQIYQQFFQQTNHFIKECNQQIFDDETQHQQEIMKIQNQEQFYQDPLQLQLKMVKLKKQKIQTKEILLNKINQQYSISQIPLLFKQVYEQLEQQNKILSNESIMQNFKDCYQYLNGKISLVNQQQQIDLQPKPQQKLLKQSILNLNLSRNDSQNSQPRKRLKNSITILSNQNSDNKQDLRERLKKIKFFNSSRIINQKSKFKNSLNKNNSFLDNSIYLNPLKSKNNHKIYNNEVTSNEETLFSKNSYKHQISKKQINFEKFIINENPLSQFQVKTFCYITQKQQYLLSLQSNKLLLLNQSYETIKQTNTDVEIDDIKQIQLDTLLLVSKKDKKILKFDLNNFKVLFQYETKNRNINKIEIINNIYYFALLDNSRIYFFNIYQQQAPTLYSMNKDKILDLVVFNQKKTYVACESQKIEQYVVDCKEQKIKKQDVIRLRGKINYLKTIEEENLLIVNLQDKLEFNKILIWNTKNKCVQGHIKLSQNQSIKDNFFFSNHNQKYILIVDLNGDLWAVDIQSKKICKIQGHNFGHIQNCNDFFKQTNFENNSLKIYSLQNEKILSFFFNQFLNRNLLFKTFFILI